MQVLGHPGPVHVLRDRALAGGGADRPREEARAPGRGRRRGQGARRGGRHHPDDRHDERA